MKSERLPDGWVRHEQAAIRRDYWLDTFPASSAALVAGIIAFLCAFIPFVGDFVAVPAGVVAAVYGWVGACRDEMGTATNGREAMIGAALAGAAMFVVFLSYAAAVF